MTVTLVAGPPCAGKSTYVAKRARDGDLEPPLETLLERAALRPSPHRTARSIYRWLHESAGKK